MNALHLTHKGLWTEIMVQLYTVSLYIFMATFLHLTVTYENWITQSIHGPKQQMVDFSGASLVPLGRLQYPKLGHQCHPHLYKPLFTHPITKCHNLSICFIPLYFLCFSVAMVIRVSRIRENPNQENHRLGNHLSWETQTRDAAKVWENITWEKQMLTRAIARTQFLACSMWVPCWGTYEGNHKVVHAYNGSMCILWNVCTEKDKNMSMFLRSE